jgi:hypothetical protein
VRHQDARGVAQRAAHAAAHEHAPRGCIDSRKRVIEQRNRKRRAVAAAGDTA